MRFRRIVAGVGLVIGPGPSARQTEPQDLAAEAITELEAVVDDLREMLILLEKEEAIVAEAAVVS